MKRIGWFVCVLLYVMSAMAQGDIEYAPGQVLVRFAQKTTLEEAKTAFDPALFTIDRVLVRKLDIFLVKVDARLTVPQAIDMLAANGNVKWAQADHYVTERLVPNDTQFGSQWDMQQASDRDIDAPEAWDITTGGTDAGGNQIVVAVVDGGCQLTHTDLAANIWRNQAEFAGTAGVDDDGNGYIDDINGWDAYDNNGGIPSNSHGTHVSGTVGAIGNNASMVCGVNWNVKIMEVAASSGTTSIIQIGYGYVLDMKELWWSSGGTQGANVVSTNSSFGVDFANCTSGTYPVWNDLYTAMGEVGILSAAATANQNQNIDVVGDVPTGCSSPYIISVTNTTSMDLRNSGAAYGLTTIDLGAPGTNILSTLPGNTTGLNTGTSMATPHVAGAVGFLHAAANLDFYNYYVAHPDSAALALKQIMLDNVDSLVALQGITVSGGRLNLNNAAMAINEFVGPDPTQPNIIYASHVVDDAAGNNDAVLEAGETANLIVTLANTGVNADNVQAVLSTTDIYLTVTDANGSFGAIVQGDSADNEFGWFTVVADVDAPLEHDALMSLAITADGGYNVIRTFTLRIGERIVYWSDDVESGVGDWTHGPVTNALDQWHISTARSASPTHSWKCGNTGAMDYSDSMDAGLVSPEIMITAESELSLTHWIESEESVAFPGDSAYDGGIVEISADGGEYTQIIPATGYSHHYRTTAGGGNPFTGPLPGAPCYAGFIEWISQVFDLAAYNGQAIRFRFRFSSDNNSGGEGWYVDDFAIAGAAPFAITPDAIDDLVIYSDSDDIQLSWSIPPSGADSFRIFRSTDPGIEPVNDTLIGTTANTSFIDLGAAPLYDIATYQVIAVIE